MADLAGQLWRQLKDRFHAAEEWAAIWRPVGGVPEWLAPGIALSGLLGLVLLAGVSLLSLGVLLTALLMAYLVLEQVFGVSVELNP